MYAIVFSTNRQKEIPLCSAVGALVCAIVGAKVGIAVGAAVEGAKVGAAVVGTAVAGLAVVGAAVGKPVTLVGAMVGIVVLVSVLLLLSYIDGAREGDGVTSSFVVATTPGAACVVLGVAATLIQTTTNPSLIIHGRR